MWHETLSSWTGTYSMNDYIWIKRAEDQQRDLMHALEREDALRQIMVSMMHETFWQRVWGLFGLSQEAVQREPLWQTEAGGMSRPVREID